VSDQLIQLVQTRVRDFARRVMTFEDFLSAAAAERLAVELKHQEADEQLVRKPPAKITLNAGLSEKYRTFSAFHALAHWFGHPGHLDFYLGSPGWLGAIELEASMIGYLALAPHPQGPPYPRLVRAGLDAQQIEMEFLVEYPVVEVLEGGRVRWRRRKTKLIRPGQAEFPWGEEEPAEQLFLPGTRRTKWRDALAVLLIPDAAPWWFGALLA
jgi:hypothetical protein